MGNLPFSRFQIIHRKQKMQRQCVDSHQAEKMHQCVYFQYFLTDWAVYFADLAEEFHPFLTVFDISGQNCGTVLLSSIGNWLRPNSRLFNTFCRNKTKMHYTASTSTHVSQSLQMTQATFWLSLRKRTDTAAYASQQLGLARKGQQLSIVQTLQVSPCAHSVQADYDFGVLSSCVKNTTIAINKPELRWWSWGNK